MKIITGGREYAVTGAPCISNDTVRYPLAEAPEAVGDTVRLIADTGMGLREDAVRDWLRAYVEGTVLVLTNIPETRPPEPDLEALKAARLAELSRLCKETITAGCDVTLADGAMGHISLTAEDQINLSTALAAVEQGAAGYPYHLDGELCAVFPAADIAAMARAATAHKLYHTTYYNHLAAWAGRCGSAADLEAVSYGAALPEDLAENMAAVLAAVEQA